MAVGTSALVRELPRKWNIGLSAITIDADLHTDETARTVISLAGLPRAELPSQLPIGPRALGSAQREAEVEVSETCSKQAMERALETDRDHIDSRARVGLYYSLLTLIFSPAPPISTRLTLVISVLGWGIRMLVVETVKRTFTRK